MLSSSCKQLLSLSIYPRLIKLLAICSITLNLGLQTPAQPLSSPTESGHYICIVDGIPGNTQHQKLTGNSISHSSAATKCFPRFLPLCSPFLILSHIKSLLKRNYSHHVAYRTAVGRKIHNYEDSIYVINTDLCVFVQTVQG